MVKIHFPGRSSILFILFILSPFLRGVLPVCADVAGTAQPRSIRRIVKQVAFGNGTKNRTSCALAAVVNTVLANAVQQPVGALRMVNHRSAAKRV